MTDAPDLSRRRLFQGAAGLCAVAALGLGDALLADSATAANGIKRLPDGRVKVTLAKVPGLASVGGSVLLGRVKGRPVAVVRTGSSTYVALDLQCTHQGVTVRRSGTSWRCPAHGSTFATAGTRTGGPAASNLARVKAVRSGGALIVG